MVHDGSVVCVFQSLEAQLYVENVYDLFYTYSTINEVITKGNYCVVLMTDFLDFDPDNDEIVNHELVEHDLPSTHRSVARRVALQALYEIDAAKHDVADVLKHLIADNEEHSFVKGYITRLVKGVLESQSRLDHVLQDFASEWPLLQVATIDRNILRIALYEMCLDADIPIGVAIDEAVSLAKFYGAENAPRFINGVLGAIADQLDVVRASLLSSPQELE